MIQTRKYLDVFPGVKLKSDHSRVDDWAIDAAKQSTYFGSGVGGAIIGKGCKNAAILDDPIKNLEDSLSEIILDKTYNWYLSTFKSRMETGCPEIHIATRWSIKDPIGRILEDAPDSWTTVSIPALTNEGKSFCEAVKTTDEYLELKNLLDEFIWEAEFMQNPVEAKGLLFPKAELNFFSLDEFNEQLVTSVIGYTDTADEGTDFLSSVTGKLIGNDCYITDVVFTQDPVEVTEALVAAQIKRNQHVLHRIESNFGGKSYARRIQTLITDPPNPSMCKIKWVPNYKNKETRILMSSGMIKQYFHFRNDYAPGSDYDRFMRQLTSYVKMGRNKGDDAPDSLTGLSDMVFQSSGIRFLNTNK
jgi:predicted phage terminase large subunit-like protein